MTIRNAIKRVLAEENGWRQCPTPQCQAFIERTFGCRHMKCTQCAAEFCDLCGDQLDPQTWQQHFNPPNECRLWGDITDLLQNDGNLQGHVQLQVDDQKYNQ